MHENALWLGRFRRMMYDAPRVRDLPVAAPARSIQP
jgi:hypothetical protein